MERIKIVTTSWDDGHQMDEKLASLLLKYNIKGTFYIAKNWIEKYGNTHLIKELDKNFEIGGHTLSHPILPNLPMEKAIAEIKNSKEWLEELLGHKIEMFSYPKGKYNKQVIGLMKRAGFNGARTTDLQIGFPRNPFMLGISSHASDGSPLLRLKALLKSRKLSLKSLLEWRISSKLLFDYVLENGGIWHLWGHSWEIDKNEDWDKLEEILKYISGRENVFYLENGQIIRLALELGYFEGRSPLKDICDT